MFLLVIFACQNINYNEKEYSFKNIEPKIYVNDQEIIHMSNITPFSWNKLYIFKPYTAINDINETLGFLWIEAKATKINQDDSFNLLVFTKKDSVVNYIRWPRSKGDFSKIRPAIYSEKSAKFILKKEKNGSQDWFYFLNNN